jgi:tRNA threonylcarbamoyladenosine biosynthesis protein TsaB
MVVVARERMPSGTMCWHSAGRHAEDLFDHIESAMADADVSRNELSLVGVSIGPGGFTSLRVGLAAAKGLSLGLDIPIVGVSSLRVLARSIEGDDSHVRVPMLNAYRGDVFAAAFTVEGRTISEVVAPIFGPPEEVLACIRERVGPGEARFGGPAAAPNQSAIEQVFGSGSNARSVCAGAASPEGLLAEVLHCHEVHGPADLVRLEPNYLRAPDAQLPKPTSRAGRID